MQPDKPTGLTNKVALITGAARRIGAHLARALHGEGMNLVIHFRSSSREAEALRHELNASRANSAQLLRGDLLEIAGLPELVRQAQEHWGRLDLLVNNASSFYPTPVGAISPKHWDELVGTNLKAPLFLSQAAAPHLAAAGGNIVNIVDIHGLRPLQRYPLYSTAKAGLVMLTKALACELGPAVRVNGIAPGPILWPEGEAELSAQAKKHIVEDVILKRQGTPDDIATALIFLVRDGRYVTGQLIAVDGGRSLAS